MKRIIKGARPGLMGLAVFTCPLAATAVQPNDDAFEDLPIVLSASRLRQPLVEAPSAVTVIDRAMIKASGVRNIADLMRLVPGATVGYEDGNRPVVAVRGMSAVYNSGLQVLVDGVSMYSPLWGGMQWETLPLALNDIESIEVIRGPNAALFGPNSFSGVINIQTRHPDTDPGSYAELTLGEGNIEDAVATHSGRTEAGLRYRATIGQRASNGFDTRPDSQRLSYGNVRTDYSVGITDSFAATMRWGNGVKGVGDYAPSSIGDYSQPHTSAGRREDLQLRWTHNESSDDQWWIQYYHSQEATLDGANVDLRDTLSLNKTLITIPIPYRIDLDFSTRRDGLEFQQTRRLSDTARMVWGVESRHDAAISRTVFGDANQRTSSLLRGYGSLEWVFQPTWTLHLASMVERNTLASTGWSPKLTVTWQPVEGHVFRVGTSSALRTPTLLEKKANFGYTLPATLPAPYTSYRFIYSDSTGVVDSEFVRADEVGYAFELPTWRMRGDARYFWQGYHGLVARERNPANNNINDYFNRYRAELNGGDLSLQWQPLDVTRFWFSLSRTTVMSNRPDIYGHSAPDTTVSVLVDQKLPSNWGISANYQRVSRMYWTDSGSAFRSIPPVEYLNLRLAKQVAMPGLSSSEVAVGVINAMGNHIEYYATGTGKPTTMESHRAYLQLVGRF